MKTQRNTIQRSIILDTVIKLQNHVTADEVYNEIIKNHPTISRGTIYRNLNMLAEDGEIKKVEVSNGADRFDHILFKHYHIKCSICEKIFDIEMEYIENLEKSIKNTNGFEFSSHDIMFKGICPTCKLSN